MFFHVFIVTGNEALAITFEHHGSSTPVSLHLSNIAVLFIVYDEKNGTVRAREVIPSATHIDMRSGRESETGDRE